jgi:hypothetical protein
MSTARQHATEPLQLSEAHARAWLRSLCRKLQTVHERHEARPLDLPLGMRVDLVAEMIGELAGLEVEEIYELFDRGGGTARGLMRELEPLPADVVSRLALSFAAEQSESSRPLDKSAAASHGQTANGTAEEVRR